MIAATNKRKRKRTSVDPYDKGTEQTRKRIKRESTLDRLIREGRVNPDMERAAREIEQVYYAITRRLFAKTSSLEKVDKSEPKAPDEWLTKAYLERYIPWTEELKHIKSPTLAIIYDVIIDGRSLRQADRDRKVRNGFSRQLTISGLKLYADLAGWGR